MGMSPIIVVVMTSIAALTDQKANCVQSASLLGTAAMNAEMVRAWLKHCPES